MLEGITSRQFAEWQAFFELEPFGSRWEDLRAGQLAAVLRAAVLGAGGVKAKPATAEQLFPPPDAAERKAQTQARLKAVMASRRKKRT